MDRSRELISFTKNLYYLTKMGANLTEIFGKIKRDISDRPLKDAVSDLKDKMEQGTSLTESMEDHPEVFPADYVKMIEVAEKTDTLPQVLYELSSYLESVEVTRRNMRAAAFYPGLVINIAFIFIFFIYSFVSETLFNQYVDFSVYTGQILTPLAWFFIGAARFIFSPLFIVIMLIIVIVTDIILFTRSTAGTSLFLRLPFIGEIFRKSYIIRISRSLGFMLKQGITLDKAIELAAKTAESSLLGSALMKASEKISRGRSLGEALEGIAIFDNTFLFMVKQGEKTGNLPGALFDGADYYEDEMNMLYSNVLKLAEPLFIMTVGVIVGFLVVSVFMPFYSITGAIK